MKTMHYSVITMWILLSCNNSFAQTDSIVTDTLSEEIAEKAVQLLIKSDSLAMEDSIYILLLNKQLDELKTYERSKRASLERELREIRLKDSTRKALMIEEVNLLKSKALGYPIIIHKDTLFIIYTKIGSISAEERAKVITERLHELYRVFILKNDSLVIMHNSQSVEIFHRDKIMLSVTEMDELWFEKPRMEIAEEYRKLIINDIAVYKEDISLMKILKEIGLATLVIFIQVSLIIIINRIFRRKVNILIWKKRGVWFKGIKFRNFEVLNQDREATAIIWILKIFRYFIIVLLLYISIPILFSIFPITQRFAEVLFGYIVNPLKTFWTAFVSYISELITILVIIIVTRYFLKFLKFVAKEIETERLKLQGFYPDWAKPTYSIIKLFILAFMFVLIYPLLPSSNSQVFKGVSVFIGIVISLGSTSIIANLIAGLVITYMRPFKIGDRIKLGEVVGNIVEKTPFVIRVRTPKKEFITIPNSNVLTSNVINYSRSKQQGGLIVHTTVTIGYDVPWRKVHQILMNAAKETSNLNMDIAPFVLQTSLDDFYVSYQLNAHTNEPDKQPQIYSELHQNIQDGFNEAGIEILSPHYRSARDGNPMAIPKDYLPEDYQSPGFKVTDSQKKNTE